MYVNIIVIVNNFGIIKIISLVNQLYNISKGSFIRTNIFIYKVFTFLFTILKYSLSNFCNNVKSYYSLILYITVYKKTRIIFLNYISELRFVGKWIENCYWKDRKYIVVETCIEHVTDTYK